MTARRGRPPLPPELRKTPEQLAEARKASKATTKNVTLDADLVEALSEFGDGLADEFGFRPTLSQSIRYMIKHARIKP